MEAMSGGLTDQITVLRPLEQSSHEAHWRRTVWCVLHCLLQVMRYSASECQCMPIDEAPVHHRHLDLETVRKHAHPPSKRVQTARFHPVGLLQTKGLRDKGVYGPSQAREI